MDQGRDLAAEYPITAPVTASPQCTVYRSRAADGGRDVAVKIIHPGGHASGADDDACHHFERVMGAVQFLRLPAFPEVVDFGCAADGSAFLVTAWVDGVGLDRLGDANPRRVLPLLVQVVDALEALAMGEVHHLNLSPANILVTETEAGREARLVGLGTAAVLAGAAARSLLGHSPDSDRYLAPERLEAQPEAASSGAAADLYSLALIAVELLSGEVDGLGSAHPRVRFAASVRATLTNPDALAHILGQALASDPAARTTTYPLLKRALELASSEAPSPVAAERLAPPPSPPLQESPADVEFTTQVAHVGPGANAGGPTPPLGYDPNRTDPAWHPPAGEEAAEEPVAAAEEPVAVPDEPPATAVAPPPRRRLSLALVAVLAFLATLGGFAAVIFGLRLQASRQAAAPPVVVQAEPSPTAAPAVAPAPGHPLLVEAEGLLAAGDPAGARALLATLGAEAVVALSPADRELYQGLVTAAQGSAVEAAMADLEGGLAQGSVRLLKRAVAAIDRLSPADYAERPGVETKLATARAALDLQARLARAHDGGDHAQTVELAGQMITTLPGNSAAATYRQEAAAALEAEAEALAVAGRYREAGERLAPLATHWPERAGLSERLAAVARGERLLAEQERAVRQALERDAAGAPDEGLALLTELSPLPVLGERVAAVRQQLETRLAELDRGTPTVGLAPGAELKFKKKDAALVELAVTDDHRVTGVVAFVRVAGSTEFSRVVLGRGATADRFLLSVAPELHRNEDFAFYAEATDPSGHVGRFGSAEQPLEVKKAGFIKGLFGK